MKKYFTTILLFFTFITNAQYNDWTKVEVYLQSGEILFGRARLSMSINSTERPTEKKYLLNEIRIGNKEYLRFITGKERRSIKFSPEEIEKVVFDLDYKEKRKRIKRKATFIPIYKNENKTMTGFAELIIDGKIKLVKKKISGVGIVRNYLEESLFIRENEHAVPFNYADPLVSFKKSASEYFYDCKDLISKFETKEFKRDDLEAIVNYYNDNCAK